MPARGARGVGEAWKRQLSASLILLWPNPEPQQTRHPVHREELPADSERADEYGLGVREGLQEAVEAVSGLQGRRTALNHEPRQELGSGARCKGLCSLQLHVCRWTL